MDKLTEVKQDVKSRAGGALSDIVDDVTSRFSDIDEKIAAQVDMALKRARNAGACANTFAKESPWQLAALALAVGIISGLWMRKRD